MAVLGTRSLGLKSMVQRGLETHVGNTPLVPLASSMRKASSRVRVLAKAEWFNPSGSVKDRPALSIVRSGVARAELGEGRRLLDSTSGNMGIAYATLAASFGISVTLCLPASASSERLTILRALGAELILTDASEGSDGAMHVARGMAEAEPRQYWYANQYDNAANWEAHYKSTGPEIVAQTNGAISHLVAGLGTSGTLVGTGRYLREKIPGVQIVAVEPDAGFHGLEGLKHMPSAVKPGIFDPLLADRTIQVSTEAAHAKVRELARGEGLFVGISSGAAAVAAAQIAAEVGNGTIVTIFPDSGYRYLSDQALWEGT
jgi:cysteine synthase B